MVDLMAQRSEHFNEALDRAARRLEALFGDEVLPLEDYISRAVRRHVPDVQEKIGSLPYRLRLLGLTGEERARTILSNLTNILKEDASEVIAVLGAIECTILEDVRWALTAVDILDNGAEEKIQQANLQRYLAELDTLFQGKVHGLLPTTELNEWLAVLHERIEVILSSYIKGRLK